MSHVVADSGKVAGKKPLPLILIPARNEEASVGGVVRAAKAELDCEVVVIDDFSDDATAEVAGAAGAVVLSLASRLGAWGAMQTGLRYALRNGCEIAITMDADGQHSASSLRSLLTPILSGKADVVIGACAERASPARHTAWSLFRWISGLTIEDLTSGLRAYNATAISLLASKPATLLDYQDVGVLMVLLRAGLRVVEVEVEMGRRKAGHSRVFSSWWVVGRYMVHNSILCLAKRRINGQV